MIIDHWILNITMVPWEQIYDALGAKNFIYFISSPELQQDLLPVKIVFIAFALFFLTAVLYFYVNSSYLTYLFFQDVREFITWQSYSQKALNRRLKNIIKKTELGTEPGYKLAIAEIDDLFRQILEDMGYEGKDFEQLIENASKKARINKEDIIEANKVRNSIVYDPQYKLDIQQAKKVLTDYEKAIKEVVK